MKTLWIRFLYNIFASNYKFIDFYMKANKYKRIECEVI